MHLSFVSSNLCTSRSVQLAASSIGGVRTCSPSSAYIDHASRLAVRIVKPRQREEGITSHCRFSDRTPPAPPAIFSAPGGIHNSADTVIRLTAHATAGCAIILFTPSCRFTQSQSSRAGLAVGPWKTFLWAALPSAALSTKPTLAALDNRAGEVSRPLHLLRVC